MLPMVGATTVFFIAVTHIYWGFGGKFWADKAVPTTDDGAPLFVPGKVATFVVVGVLFVACWAVLSDGAAAKVISGVFALIFFARFVGEFGYVGMFKKHKNTVFARMDTLVYSPLCLFLSVCYLASIW